MEITPSHEQSPKKEMTEIKGADQPVPERLAQSEAPAFIEAMRQDYPELANEIEGRINDWIIKVDQMEGQKGMGQAFVDTMEYITHAEVLKFIHEVVNEIKELLRQNPNKKIYLVTYSLKGGSGKYFFEQINTLLTQEEKNQINLVSSIEMTQILSDEEAPIFFYVDDSANSGQQLNQTVFKFRNYVRDLEDDLQKQKALQIKPQFHIRLLRVTDKVKNFIISPDEGQVNFMKYQDEPLVIIDMATTEHFNKKMVTSDDAIAKLGLNQKQIKSSGSLLTSHHGRIPATLGIFWHKIQDNMPIAVIEGQWKTGFDPLIKNSDTEKMVKPYPTNYSSIST